MSLVWTQKEITVLNQTDVVLNKFNLSFSISNIVEIADKPQNYLFAYNGETGEYIFFTFTLSWEPLILGNGFLEFKLSSFSAYGGDPTRLTAYSSVTGIWYIWSVSNKKLTLLRRDTWSAGWDLVEAIGNEKQTYLLCYRFDSGQVTLSKLEGNEYTIVYDGQIEESASAAVAVVQGDLIVLTVYSTATGWASRYELNTTKKLIGSCRFEQDSRLFKLNDLVYLYDKKNDVVTEVLDDTKGQLFGRKSMLESVYKHVNFNVMRHDVLPSLVLMNFNVWNSGSRVYNGIESIAKIIVEHQADIVGVQEMDADGMEELAKILGEKYFCNYYTGIVSKCELHKIYANIQGVPIWGGLLQLPNGWMVKVLNSHLTAYPYGPYFLRESGFDVDKTIHECEKNQGRDILNGIDNFVNNEDFDLLTVLFGDHNIPSHLDHTRESSLDQWLAKERKLKIVPIEWPVSKALYHVGFQDTCRVVWPDVRDYPGFTWTPGAPKGTLIKDEILDRIDFIYAKPGKDGMLKPVHTYTIGDVKDGVYPSDHFAVVTHVLLQ
jgi:hypothetical protein